MAAGEIMTCPRAQLVLCGSIQTARNVVCALVTQKLAEQVTAKGRNFSATYRITDAGRQRVWTSLGLRADDERDDDEAAERAVARARIEANIAWAREMVPKSVFDLARSLQKPNVGASA